MVRHTDTWIFNIDEEIWNECVGHLQKPEVRKDIDHEGPVFGFKTEEAVSKEEFKKGDLALVRIVSEDSGIAAIWEIDSVVSVEEATTTIPERDFDCIIHCDVIQSEFNSIYRENWERFAEVAQADISDVERLGSESIINLPPAFKKTYIEGLLEHDSVTQTVRERLNQATGANLNFTQRSDDVTHPLISHIETSGTDVYKFTAPPDYWLTAYEYAAISFSESDSSHWEALEPGDVVVFHSRSLPDWDALDEQPNCILGAGIIRQKATISDHEPWGYGEHPNSSNDETFPYVISFKNLYVTGDIGSIDLSRSILTKDTEEVNEDLRRLTANSMSFTEANKICSEITSTGFPVDEVIERIGGPETDKQALELIRALAPRLQKTPPVAINKRLDRDIAAERILDGLYFPDDIGKTIVEQIEAALSAGDHVILTGPPGTGKTEIADRVAAYLADAYPYLYSGAELTTATADWSTFDTVGGYMPTESNSGNTGTDLAFTPGIVLNRLKDTQTGDQSNELIIIDELNRADIDKAFGQLFTLLSGQSVQLPFTKNNREIELLTTEHLNGLPAENQYVVPESWRIFATMNTYDKTSLYEMSYAFMRRFAFIRVPAPEFKPDNDEEALDEIRTEMDAYIAVWDEISPSDQERDAIGLVWKHTNHAVDERSIGPAIVRDMLGYVTNRRTGPDEDISGRITEAVISYIFPQLEGVPERKQIIRQIATVDAVDTSRLTTAARDMLQIKLNLDE